MKKAGIIIISFIMTMLLSACGAKMQSEVKISDVGSGSRTFTVEMAKSEIKGKVSIDEIEGAIQDACPECLECTFGENGKNYSATFVMDFTSVEDYEQKLNTFCKQNADVNLELSPSHFAQKVVYSENLTSREMFTWFIDALVNGGIVAPKYRDSVIEESNTTVDLGGRVYDAGEGRISIDEEKYCAIESIDLYTLPSEEGKFARIIKLNIRESELAKNEQAIKAFLEEAIPEGGTGVWEENKDSSIKTFSVSLAGLNATEMADAMKKYTGSSECAFTEEDSADAVGVFCKDAAFSESLDFSNYACNSAGTVKVNYLFDENLTGGDLTDRQKGGVVSPSESIQTTSNTYLVYSLGEINKSNILANMVHYYHFMGITYTLDAKGPQDISKEIVFYFDNQGTKEIGDAYDKIRVMSESDETVAKIKVSLDDDALTLRFEGSASEINHMTEAITGKNTGGISYAYENKWLSPTTKCIVVDTMDLDGFVYQDPEESEYWQIPVQYTAKIYGSKKKVTPKQDGISKKGKGFTGVISSGKRMKLTYTTNRMNKTAFLWYLLIFGALVFFIGGICLKVSGDKEERKERSAKAREKAKAYDEELKQEKEKAMRARKAKKEEKEDKEEEKQEEEMSDEEAKDQEEATLEPVENEDSEEEKEVEET